MFLGRVHLMSHLEWAKTTAVDAACLKFGGQGLGKLLGAEPGLKGFGIQQTPRQLRCRCLNFDAEVNLLEGTEHG